ncbi:MAG: hemerythrin domain-containing protein [Alphaproteobacteria bacterium]
MDILEYLKNDHDKVRNLLTRLVSEPINKDLFIEFQEELMLHNKVEEQIFYKELQERAGNLDIIADASKKEHSLVEDIINYINTNKFEPQECKVLIPILKATIEAHILKEEENIFSLAKNIISEEERNMLGKKFAEEKERNVGNVKPHIRTEANTDHINNYIRAATQTKVFVQEDA